MALWSVLVKNYQEPAEFYQAIRVGLSSPNKHHWKSQCCRDHASTRRPSRHASEATAATALFLLKISSFLDGFDIFWISRPNDRCFPLISSNFPFWNAFCLVPAFQNSKSHQCRSAIVRDLPLQVEGSFNKFKLKPGQQLPQMDTCDVALYSWKSPRFVWKTMNINEIHVYTEHCRKLKPHYW